MVWTAERTTVAQRVQIGAESTGALGTSVNAGKLLECYDWVFGIDADIKTYRPSGHKYSTVQEENTEWTAGTITGSLDYNGMIYPMGGAFGAVSAVAHGASTTAKDWIFTPNVTTPSIVPQTYTVQQGDAIRAHKTTYLLFNEFGYKATRKDFSISGKWMGLALTDNITLTASPTAIALAPAPSKHLNVYLDSTSGGLGTTQLTRVLSVDYVFTNVYGPLWVLNRSSIGYTAHVDLVPKATVKLLVEADANGMALLAYMQTGTTYYLRVQAQGSVAIATDGPGNIYNTWTHDMAIKLIKPASTFKDDQGVFAIEWEAEIVEDPAWTVGSQTGAAQTMTLTNLITAL